MPRSLAARRAARQQRRRDRICANCPAPAAPMVALCAPHIARERVRDEKRRAGSRPSS